MRLSLLAVLGLALAACNAPEQDPVAEPALDTVVAEAGPEPGMQAPAFTLADTNGESHTLADYEGQVVVLEWLNYDCPFVAKHYGGENMQALQAQAAEDGVVWLSVVSSAPGEQGHFANDVMNTRTADEGGRQRAVLMDESGDVGRLYDAKTTPQMVIIDTDGTITYNGAIDDTPSTDVADLETSQSYLAPALASTLAGEPVETARTTPYGCSVKYASDA